MALIDLPNEAQWNTDVSQHEQSLEAHEYVNSVLASIMPNVDSQEEVGQPSSGVYRWLQRSYNDVESSLTITETRTYVNAASHAASGAVASYTVAVQES